MHKTVITGNITQNGATLRTTGNGDKVLGFSVGVSNGKDSNGNWRDKTFFDCSIWGKRATSLEQYLTAGKSLTLFGRVGAREHNGKAYLQLSVDDFAFNEVREGQSGNQGGARDPDPTQQASGGYGAGGRPSQDLDDEVPF